MAVSLDNSPLVADLREASRFFRAKGIFGQKCVWVAFVATCLQLTFLHPYLVIIPGERANVFSGLLCALVLLSAWAFMSAGRIIVRSPEFLMSIGLSALMVLSSVFSTIPESSSARAFTMLASGLGGFWCARLMLAGEGGRRMFRCLSIFALSGLIVVSLCCYYIYGDTFQCVDSNQHPLASRILLLWFAPLSLIIMVARPSWFIFSALIGGSYAVFFLSDLRSACLIPVALLVIAFGARMLKLKYLLAVLIPLGLLLVVFFLRLPTWKMGKEHEPTYYRFESYFFAVHIAMKHPWLGVGLRGPKDQFLADYEIHYPYVSKERFAQSVKTLVSSENTFLSFLVDVGCPFTLLYIFSLIVLLKRLIRQFRRPGDAILFHPLVLLLPITAGLLHFQVLDGLYHPQVSWFFHILLGLIPPSPRDGHSAAPEESVQKDPDVLSLGRQESELTRREIIEQLPKLMTDGETVFGSSHRPPCR